MGSVTLCSRFAIFVAKDVGKQLLLRSAALSVQLGLMCNALTSKSSGWRNVRLNPSKRARLPAHRFGSRTHFSFMHGLPGSMSRPRQNAWFCRRTHGVRTT